MEHDGDTSYALFQWSSCGLPSRSNYLNLTNTSNHISNNSCFTPTIMDGQARGLATRSTQCCRAIKETSSKLKKVIHQSTNPNTQSQIQGETSEPKSLQSTKLAFLKPLTIGFSLTNATRLLY